MRFPDPEIRPGIKRLFQLAARRDQRVREEADDDDSSSPAPARRPTRARGLDARGCARRSRATLPGRSPRLAKTC